MDDGEVFVLFWFIDGIEEGMVKEYFLLGNVELIFNLVVMDGGVLFFKWVSVFYVIFDGENFEELLINVLFFDVDGGGVGNV